MKPKILAILFLGLLLQSIPSYAEEARKAILLKISGLVQVRTLGSTDWRVAESGMVLNEKDEIRTGKDSTAELLLDDEGKTGRLELASQSRLLLNTMKLDGQTGNKTTLLDLALGDVLVHAQKLHGDSRFQVRTANSTTGVRGTVFKVSARSKPASEDKSPNDSK